MTNQPTKKRFRAETSFTGGDALLDLSQLIQSGTLLAGFHQFIQDHCLGYDSVAARCPDRFDDCHPHNVFPTKEKFFDKFRDIDTWQNMKQQEITVSLFFLIGKPDFPSLPQNISWGVFTAYDHLSEILVQPGDVLKAGQVVGLGGETGRTTGPHLHWEVWVGGVQVDPVDWLESSYP